MGAVVYVRVIEENFHARSTLLVAKTRVAPLKNIIARLELSAGVLLAQLVAKVRWCLGFSEVPVHLWTDSSVALTWIQGHPSRWKEYVSNRVALIKELVPDGKWHHVAGSENPADSASRGLFPRQLLEHPSWWTGPKSLQHPSTAWQNTFLQVLKDVNLEEKPVAVMTTAKSDPEVWNFIEKYSRIERLLRITAVVLAAAGVFRQVKDEKTTIITPTRKVSYTPVLFQDALGFWIKATQNAYFRSEIDTLKSGKLLPSSSTLLRLTPIFGADGYLRVGGRLQRADLDFNCRHPIILPKAAKLSNLLIDEAHGKTLHGGVQLTLATLHQRFWILGGRLPVRFHIRSCVPCARHRGVTMQQQMGQLPAFRTKPTRPFLNTGVDYAGAYQVKAWSGRKATTYKGYIVVFICFATSALHLELVSDYTSEGFLAAYRRFSSRRGICERITSDCGTNFIGADAELRRMFDAASDELSHIRSILANDRTEWYFNPPSAPHFGGKWEAAVKSVKYHLRRVVGEHLKTFEQFTTLLAQIEGVLNSRPLCPMSDDPSDYTALTPGHFLIGEAISTIPEPSLADVNVSRLSLWEKTRLMLEHFWARWSREYLSLFQTVDKWHRPDEQLQVGLLVLVKDERYPPGKWPLARVESLHPGGDGLSEWRLSGQLSVLPSREPLSNCVCSLSLMYKDKCIF